MPFIRVHPFIRTRITMVSSTPSFLYAPEISSISSSSRHSRHIAKAIHLQLGVVAGGLVSQGISQPGCVGEMPDSSSCRTISVRVASFTCSGDWSTSYQGPGYSLASPVAAARYRQSTSVGSPPTSKRILSSRPAAALYRRSRNPMLRCSSSMPRPR